MLIQLLPPSTVAAGVRLKIWVRHGLRPRCLEALVAHPAVFPAALAKPFAVLADNAGLDVELCKPVEE